MKRILALLVAAVFSFSLVATPVAFAEDEGKLKSFEKEGNEPEPSTSAPESTTSLDAGSIAAEGIMTILMQFLMMGLMTSGMEDPAGLYRELKQEWHPALPTIRIEPAYQWMKGNINGFSGKLEAGYLIFGIDGEYNRLWEKNPSSTLDIWSAHFMLRTVFARFFGTNLAIGAKGLRGTGSRTGIEVGMPFYIYFTKVLYLDILPYLATFNGSQNVYDLGGGISFKWKMLGARAGYRALFTGGQVLQGPRIGLFFQW
jgi:hypothetical protein